MESNENRQDQAVSDEAFKLDRLRHSASHILAQAVTRLYPGAKLAIGPSIQDGFYYDIDVDTTFSEEDLEKIAAEMKRIVKENQPFSQESWSKDKARAYFSAHQQDYKLELIEGIADEEVSVFINPQKGDAEPFIDLCAGPHVPRTGNAKHFKLLKVSGAYWRGDATKAQLQRIYGTAWTSKDDLDAYLFRLEEAKKRDHRRLGKELDLFLFSDLAPGAPFWLPNGEDLYENLVSRMRTLLRAEGYSQVRTPLIYDKALWETSGHWGHYHQHMFHFSDGETEGDETRIYGLKPMNCPAHMVIYRSKKRSYRDLPLRYSDQGVLHRNELSGALSGLTRVRQFSQDDAHIFVAEDQIQAEVERLLDLINRVYGAFDMGYQFQFSTRPADKLGDDALWDQAESALEAALKSHGAAYTVNEGDGAFYGPKIDFQVLDALGRAHQCATIQLDYQLPQRFELSYVGADNTLHTPVVIHRAILGSFERFIGILIEHFAGNFPVWLAPEQVRVMTVSEKSVAHGNAVVAALSAAGIKVVFDDSANKIGYKIRECHGKKVPYMVVIGEKELEEGTVSIRSRDHGDLGSMTVEDFVARVAEEARPRF
ncbi:MAG: threonine--tRNA ligase [Deltaproteobacteria bacterium]|nr:threonine--tRNA ligase [Deltaproteobacteria bacterium]